MKRPRVISSIRKNVQRFFELEAASGITLAIASILALAVANSSFASIYEATLATKVGPYTLLQWINDGLMAIFFFVVGMEIKYELIDGALNSRERASLPIFAALGGMIVPALIFLAFNAGTEVARGWGIPMATDIAFAVGILTLVGRRVPTELKIFLLALAIADDLGAVLVIALFYTAAIDLAMLAASLGLLGLVWFLGQKNVRFVPLHAALGILIWYLVHHSGVHATVAGCALGFIMPHGDDNPHDPTPLERWVHRLHPIVSFLIMPVFAFANAGLNLKGLDWSRAFADPLVRGIGAGLVVGKVVGIFGFSYVAEKLGFAKRPDGISWQHLFGAACLGGVGFTMALFVSQLALQTSAQMDLAKIGILTGSSLAAILGALVLLRSRPA